MTPALTACCGCAAAVTAHSSRGPRSQHRHRPQQAPRWQRCGPRTMTTTEATAWRRWLPAAAAAVALLIAAAALLAASSPGGLQRSPRLLLHRLAASRMALATPADGVSGMRLEREGSDPLAATALIRGVPTQRMTAPDLGFSQASPLPFVSHRRFKGSTHESYCMQQLLKQVSHRRGAEATQIDTIRHLEEGPA